MASKSINVTDSLIDEDEEDTSGDGSGLAVVSQTTTSVHDTEVDGIGGDGAGLPEIVYSQSVDDNDIGLGSQSEPDEADGVASSVYHMPDMKDLDYPLLDETIGLQAAQEGKIPLHLAASRVGSCPSLAYSSVEDLDERRLRSSDSDQVLEGGDRKTSRARSRSQGSLFDFDLVDHTAVDPTIMSRPASRTLPRVRTKSMMYAMQAAAEVQQADWLAKLDESRGVVSRLVETQEDDFASYTFHEPGASDAGSGDDHVPDVIDPVDAMLQFGQDISSSFSAAPAVTGNKSLSRSAKSSSTLGVQVKPKKYPAIRSGRRASTPSAALFGISKSPERGAISLSSSPADTHPPVGKLFSSGDYGKSIRNASTSASKVSTTSANASPHRTGWQNQASLMDYLTTKETHTELDRENSHFAVAEVLISAFEQMNAKQQQSHLFEDDYTELPLSISSSGQNSPMTPLNLSSRRGSGLDVLDVSRSRHSSSARSSFTGSTGSSCGSELDLSDYDSVVSGSAEDGLDRTVTSQGLPSPLVINSNAGGAASDGPAGFNAAEVRNAAYEGDISTEPSSSANSVAKSLLHRFGSIKLHTASELQAVMNEEGLPRALLGLDPARMSSSPSTVAASSDGRSAVEVKRAEAVLSALSASRPRIRGDDEWAPPRSQIIFQLHPPQKKKMIGSRQKFRCAGCGMQVEPSLIKRFRYCEYLGKYFCHSCHGNKTAYIPARILQKWDFRKYSVSNFASDLLMHMFKEPLFSVNTINPALYRQVKAMATCQSIRAQLFYLKDFIRSCRLAQNLREQFEDQGHWVSEPHVYSVEDLTMVRQGSLHVILSSLVEAGVKHVETCDLCQARGFVCEVCRKGSIIFPFQLDKCSQCPGCRASYHKSCFQPMKTPCPKCRRLEKRREVRSSKNPPISP